MIRRIYEDEIKEEAQDDITEIKNALNDIENAIIEEDIDTLENIIDEGLIPFAIDILEQYGMKSRFNPN